jgi:hypothetical protein
MNCRTFRDQHNASVLQIDDWVGNSILSLDADHNIIVWNLLTGYAKERFEIGISLFVHLLN